MQLTGCLTPRANQQLFTSGVLVTCISTQHGADLTVNVWFVLSTWHKVLTNDGADHDTPPLDLQNLMARIYDEQIKFKVDGPSSRFVTESVSSALFPHARVVKSSKITICLCLFLDWEKIDSFTNNATRVSSKTAVSISNSQCSFLQQPNDRFPLEIFLSPLRCLCWLWCVLKRESKF